MPCYHSEIADTYYDRFDDGFMEHRATQETGIIKLKYLEFMGRVITGKVEVELLYDDVPEEYVDQYYVTDIMDMSGLETTDSDGNDIPLHMLSEKISTVDLIEALNEQIAEWAGSVQI